MTVFFWVGAWSTVDVEDGVALGVGEGDGDVVLETGGGEPGVVCGVSGVDVLGHRGDGEVAVNLSRKFSAVRISRPSGGIRKANVGIHKPTEVAMKARQTSSRTRHNNSWQGGRKQHRFTPTNPQRESKHAAQSSYSLFQPPVASPNSTQPTRPALEYSKQSLRLDYTASLRRLRYLVLCLLPSTYNPPPVQPRKCPCCILPSLRSSMKCHIG